MRKFGNESFANLYFKFFLAWLCIFDYSHIRRVICTQRFTDFPSRVVINLFCSHLNYLIWLIVAANKPNAVLIYKSHRILGILLLWDEPFLWVSEFFLTLSLGNVYWSVYAINTLIWISKNRFALITVQWCLFVCLVQCTHSGHI